MGSPYSDFSQRYLFFAFCLPLSEPFRASGRFVYLTPDLPLQGVQGTAAKCRRSRHTLAIVLNACPVHCLILAGKSPQIHAHCVFLLAELFCLGWPFCYHCAYGTAADGNQSFWHLPCLLQSLRPVVPRGRRWLCTRKQNWRNGHRTSTKMGLWNASLSTQTYAVRRMS